MLTAAAIVLGLVMLYAGGELLVRGAVGVAVSLGLSPLLIGITLVGFGTSTPELVTSIDAALRGSPGIAVGNVVGSNIANILLILGLGAVIAPIAFTRRALSRDVFVVVLTSLAVVALAAAGEIGRGIGVALVVALAIYLALAQSQERAAERAAEEAAVEAAIPQGGRLSLWLGLPMAVVGIAVVVAGAHLLVEGALKLAVFFGVSDTVIGLTVVALGTSLPELATTATAAFRREGDVALGNVLGSCIFNVFGILGVTAIVQPLIVPAVIFTFDAWVLLATALVLVAFAVTGRRLSRAEGLVFVGAYAVYVGYLSLTALT
jgi:cation:H+ antiporter